MTRIRARKDSGNAHADQLVRQLTIAMATADTTAARRLVTGDVVWNAIGRRPVIGVDAFCKAFSRYGPATELSIEHLLSCDSSGAVNGIVRWEDNRRAFCHIYEFSDGTAVNALTSYSIRLK